MPWPIAKQDAQYYYYLHGPLRRMELGTQGRLLQGVDYAYTLQGWLKGVNSADGDPNLDMGQDGAVTLLDGVNTAVSQDAFAYSLGYYTGDYTPIGGSGYQAFALTYSQTTGDITGQSLYNGNISNTTLAVGVPSAPNPFAGNAVGYTYHYDQLNRLKKMRQYTGINGGSTWDRSYITLNDQENVTYDGNGNILTYGRNGGDTTAQTIDSLSYNYNYTGGKLLNNQLQYIHDAVTSSGYDLDLRNQTNPNNYQYDGIGNIISDAQSGITKIGWTVYNKPDTIYKSAGNITYNYNTANQRISKTYNGLTTWYVRDAQGNVLSVYDNADTTVNWREQHLYGSSRIGMWKPNIDITDSTGSEKWQWTGYRLFELNNHLGNVMTTINDVRNPYFKPSHIGPLPGPLQYFTANVLSSQDYYPFGMLMPDRQYTNGDSTYRYGFNGKENDNEVKGLGNQQDYGERMYDPRVNRFGSVDPVQVKHPAQSSYSAFNDNPLFFVDTDGKDGIASTTGAGTKKDPVVVVVTANYYYQDATDQQVKAMATVKEDLAVPQSFEKDGKYYKAVVNVNFIKTKDPVETANLIIGTKGSHFGNVLNITNRNGRENGVAGNRKIQVFDNMVTNISNQYTLDNEAQSYQNVFRNTLLEEVLHNLGGLHQDGSAVPIITYYEAGSNDITRKESPAVKNIYTAANAKAIITRIDAPLGTDAKPNPVDKKGRPQDPPLRDDAGTVGQVKTDVKLTFPIIF
jgi:RHS repeat-associated protein